MDKHINREVLGNERAAYGKQIVAPLARQLPWSHFMDNFIRVSIPYSWVEDDTKDDTKELTEQQLLDNKIDTKE